MTTRLEFLNAGHGNPNWICTTPREAYGTLIRFGVEEARRGVQEFPDPAKIGVSDGMAKRFTEFLDANPMLLA